MNICIITHVFPEEPDDSKGSAGLFVYDFIKLLIKKGHHPIVITPVKINPSKFTDIKIQRFKYFSINKPLGHYCLYNPFDLYKLIVFFILGLFEVKKNLESQHIDRCLTFWAVPSGYFAMKIFLQKNIPFDVWCLGSDIYKYSTRPFIKKMILKTLIKAKIVMADGPDLKKRVELLTKNDCQLIYSSRILPDIKMKASSKRKNNQTSFLYIGRMEKDKGIDILLKAAKSLINDSYMFRLDIIGEGRMDKHLNQILIKNPELRSIITFHKSKTIEKILLKLIQSDFLIIPSRSDSIPMVLNEALKCSIPVLTSDLPDMNSLINKYKIGLKFNSDNYKDLKEKIMYILENPEKISEYRKNITEISGIFDLKKSVKLYLTKVNE